MGKKSGKNAGKSNPTGSEPVKEKKSKQQKHKPSDSAGAAAMGVKTPEDAAAKLHAPAKPAATETASPASVDAREGLMRSYADSLRDFFGDQIEGIKSEMDPEKLSAFTREAKTIIRGGLYSGIGIVAVVMIMLVIELHSEGRIFPGVKVGTTEVGYLQKDEAKEKIVAELQGYMKTPLFFSYEGNTIEVPAQELGIRLNIDQTLEKVPTFNIQEEGLLQLLVSTYAAPGVGIDYSFDGDAVIGSLEQKFHLSDVRAKNARFVWADDELGIEPEKNGIAINRDKLIADLRNRIENVSTSPVSVEALEETPRVTAAELEKERENLVALLKMPLNLSYGDDGLTLKLIDHLDAVSFREKNALKFNNTRWALPVVITDGQVAMAKSDEVELTSRIQIEVDGGKLEPVLAENLLKDIEVPTSPANIYKDDNGKVVIDGKGEDGRSVSRPQLVEAIELAANFGISDVPVPVYVEHAPLTISDDLKELGITELIATGHSSYYGSPANRMFNISHGIKKFNGVL
ncbi:MAG TPA: peptidoglycan binding domain-containing protein, partial [Candidatus Gracilibacteria bacterium]|nr:peptidoglycan binding domain-containing protein [Candidatus Gracilibacteria bacterium]